MKIRLLGTGFAQAVNCYNTCFVLEDEKRELNDRYLLVDAGGGNTILKRLKDSGIDLNNIHDIFLTHEHIDHLLGMIWIIRMAGTAMNKGKYKGELRIYCHSRLAQTLKTIAELTIEGKTVKHIGERIKLISLEDGDRYDIIGSRLEFFDIHSTKAKQFGFTLTQTAGDKSHKLSCCGDEPYNEINRAAVSGCEWLLHEAFCRYEDREIFEPYEKSHTTVKEACENAEALGAPNLILYHTEDRNLSDRKRSYTEEGRRYYSGNLLVPDYMEVIELWENK